MFTRGLTTATESVLVGSKAKFDRIHYLHETLSAIWYHLYNLKNVKTLLEPATLLKVTLHGYFSLFKFYKWYQIVQNITYILRINRLFLRLSQNITIRRKAVSKIISSDGWFRKFPCNVKWISANHLTSIPPETIKKPLVLQTIPNSAT